MTFSLRFPAGLRARSLVLLLAAAATLVALVLPSAARADMDAAYHQCAVKADQTVWCWGLGFYGQLGPSVTMYGEEGFSFLVAVRKEPVEVTGVAGAAKVVQGPSSSCAVLHSGTVQCWGTGPLGDGSTVSKIPVTVAGLSDAVDVSIGPEHACAVRSGGQAACWGANGLGKLGDGSTTDSLVPVDVVGITNAVDVVAAGEHTCAALADGGARCWGRGSDQRLGNGDTADSPTPVVVSGVSDAVKVAATGGVSCAVLASHDVVCWGESFGSSPVSIGAAYGQVADLAMTDGMGCAVLVNGRIKCGASNNDYGAYGDGTVTTPADPWNGPEVLGIDDAVGVSVGALHACARHANGDVSCWGLGMYGSLGNGRFGAVLEFQPVPGISGVTAIADHRNGLCALTGDGTRCWGNNSSGEIAPSGTHTLWEPVAVADFDGATALAGADGVMCAVVGGAVACRGSLASPGAGAPISDATAISAQQQWGCALRSGGAVACWGTQNDGALGDGGSTSSADAVAVSGISSAEAITTMGGAACALLATGTVRCWGQGWAGQLGNGDTQSSSAPVAVNTVADATQLAGGSDHACALRSTGTVSCWGSNPYGQLGDGTTTSRSEPVDVGGIIDATAIFVYEGRSCARRAGGEVLCWGNRDESGILVPGMTADESTPLAIPAFAGADQLLMTNAGTCVIRGTNLTCVGENSDGFLGDGFMPAGHGPQPTPRKVIGFGGVPFDNGNDDGPPPVDTVPPPPAVDSPGESAEQPPVVLPPRPPVGRIAVPQLRFTGRALVLTDYRVQRSGRSCPRVATVRIAVGRGLVRRLKVRSKAGVCVVSATVKLPASASKLKRLRLSVTGSGVRSRNTAVNRTR